MAVRKFDGYEGEILETVARDSENRRKTVAVCVT